MTKKQEIKIWMVRAGEGGYLVDLFLRKSIIAIRWNEVGKIPKNISLDELKERFAKAFPDRSVRNQRQSVGQIWRFFNEFKIGDYVVTYDSDARLYYVGTIASDYQYNASLEHHQVRKVDWDSEPRFRDDLTVESKNVLGSILTIFGLPETVLDDLEKAHPGYVSEEEIADMDEMTKRFQKEEEERLMTDIISRSAEFIKDMVAGLAWDEVELLAAGLLNAMGYKTRSTPRGGDLGSDILASPDGLGLVEPRIKVEVKHKQKSKDKVSAPDIRNFVGGLRTVEKGMYISTTGFSKEANYESERANFPITLVDLDLLVELLIENYEKLEPEIKALVPLKRIYWPI